MISNGKNRKANSKGSEGKSERREGKSEERRRRWHYLAVKKLSALLRGIMPKH